MQHIISVLVKNEPGALSRMTNIFSARSYNIESLTVSTTLDTKYARATIVLKDCDDTGVEQILKQLDKLIPVINANNLTAQNSITRELVFIQVEGEENIEALLKIAGEFGAKVINISQKTYTIQAICDEKQLNSLVELLKSAGIKEIVRSGAVSILLNND